MSQENVELVRSNYDAFNRGDIPAVLTNCDPNIEWDMTHYEWLESDKYYGHEGVRRFLGDWLAIFPDYRTNIDRIIDNGEHVVVFATQRGHGAESGVGAELSYVQINTVRNGKIVLARIYADEAKALEAVGLRK